MNKNSLLTMRDLSKEDIIHILNDALLFSDSYQDWQLPLKKALVANLFFEASTRTHYSFVSSELQLGCRNADIMASASSATKGESLYDTVKTLESVGYDVIVIRHPQDAYYKQLEKIRIPIINAGDGAGDHPTQCLLDLLTMQEEFGTLHGLKVMICGDILHSRVAASNKTALEIFGADVRFAGPQAWQREGYPVIDMDEGIDKADVVMMLRVQKERGSSLGNLSDTEYLQKYGLTKERYQRMQKHAIVMHPAPVNRGIEIDGDLVEAEKSRIFHQMENGVLIRKAVIKRAFGFPYFERKML